VPQHEDLRVLGAVEPVPTRPIASRHSSRRTTQHPGSTGCGSRSPAVWHGVAGRDLRGSVR
jgi:hypothetical protein